MTEVERCRLGAGLEASRVVTGLWQIADMERDGRVLDLEAVAESMAPYAEAGLTSFDMADHYGSAEIVAGRFWNRTAAPRVELFTKWVPTPGAGSRAEVRSAVERALERMKMPALDLLQFHAWNYADPSWLDRLFWLEELRQEGLVRHLGLTNFDTAHLRIVVASGISVVSNQICFSLLDQRPARAMTALCSAAGVKLLCYGTVAGGYLTERWLGKPAPSSDSGATWSEMKYGRFVAEAGGWVALQRVLEVVHRIAARHRVSMANVATRFILDHPGVGAVIIGARLGQSSHLADNLRVFDLRFTDADRAEIRAVLGDLASIPGDSGDEYRKPPYLTASGDLSHHVSAFPSPYPVRPGTGDKTLAQSGTSWESLAGYSRAIRIGNRILVSGTTATHGDRLIGGDDPAAQTHAVIDKIEGAIQSLGGRLDQVVRTRIFVRDLADWEPVARAHGERFAGILPANTLVRAELIGPEYRVEIEAEAVVDGSYIDLPPRSPS